MRILGISAFYHDSAACILIDGKIIAAAQEERFTRIKNDAKFPHNSIRYCIEEARIEPHQIDFVVFYDKPILKFDRILETYLAFAPRGFLNFIKSVPIWLTEKLFQKNLIIKSLSDIWGNSINWKKKILFTEHHLSHAASAFFASPFNTAAILTIDGVGEWTTTSISIGNANNITIQKEIFFPHSLGLLYSAFTYYTGFKVNSGEYKLMGLAPYGEPIYAETIKNHLIDIKDDGSFSLDMSYFEYCTGQVMTSSKFHTLFNAPPLRTGTLPSQREMNLAASIQSVTEEIIIKIARDIARETGSKNLCIAGGVGLNCVANGKLLRENIFQEIWVQPAAGDSGGAIGAALAAYHIMLEQPRSVKVGEDLMKGSFLGPQFSQADISSRLSNCKAVYSILPESELINVVAAELAGGKAVGWHSGRMEFGPRALGARSILADPRSPNMQKLLNLKIKQRESFRPFAPSILFEDLQEWFDIKVDSPYMSFVADVNNTKRITSPTSQRKFYGLDLLNEQRSIIPAVTHVNHSARVQTVKKEVNPRFHSLLTRFKEVTGCPILVNTSFNVRGEPIVLSPEDAFRCFMSTEIDILIIGNAILYKADQTISKSLYKIEYELD